MSVRASVKELPHSTLETRMEGSGNCTSWSPKASIDGAYSLGLPGVFTPSLPSLAIPYM